MSPRGKAGPKPHDPEDVAISVSPSAEETPAPEITKPQAALFSEPQLTFRHLPCSIPAERLEELKTELAEHYKRLIENRELSKLAAERAKSIEAEMLPIGAALRDPVERKEVQCRWVIDQSTNSKTLYRTDTDEAIETQPISEEDRVREVENVMFAVETDAPAATEPAE